MSAAADAQTAEEDVLFSQQRGNRTILLNRPKKLNSLNLSMIEKILPRLKVLLSVNKRMGFNGRHGRNPI